jgi:hypothetical protein
MTDLITEWPLYKPFRLSGFVLGVDAGRYFTSVPEEISTYCFRCKQNQRWSYKSVL